MIYEYSKVIQDLARHEFGNGIYTEPTNSAQFWQIEDLQLEMRSKFPDLKSAKSALKKVKEKNERIL